ncbi:MAG TPA: cytochrome c, partial [Candidatus Cybelea sp.]|nr:cytochrome c [Candidatus Cybelea sp.]
FYSRNITPDPEHGIGAWTDEDFLTALRTGLSPTGAHYFSAFPFTSFTLMTDRDILDIKAYLGTLPPSAAVNRAHDVPFPLNARIAMVPWRALFFHRGPFVSAADRSPEWNRGAYLVTAVVHCPECHTPRNIIGGLESDHYFGGSRLYGPGNNYAPNITSDGRHGIGAWSIDDIEIALSLGLTPKGDFLAGPMQEVVAGTAKLSASDRHAIAVYIKSLPPLADERPGRRSEK